MKALGAIIQEPIERKRNKTSNRKEGSNLKIFVQILFVVFLFVLLF